MEAAIVLKGVTKVFGRTKAVENLDLTMPGGGLYGFIGPNGAGKTTSIRMIMSILFPDSGELSVLGYKSAMEAKDRLIACQDKLLAAYRLGKQPGDGLLDEIRELREKVK